MGLDMYLCSVDFPSENYDYEIQLDIALALSGITKYDEVLLNIQRNITQEDLDVFNQKVKEIAYWRKHSDLNGYITNLAKERYGDKIQEFNCIYLPLTKEDVQILVDMHKDHLQTNNTFEKSYGFFWGESEREDWKDSYEVFKHILKTFDFKNKMLLYYCWY